MDGFHWVDYILFVAMLIVSLGIGVYAARTGGKQKTTREFLIGNRELTLLPVFVSFLMSYTSGMYHIHVISSICLSARMRILLWVVILILCYCDLLRLGWHLLLKCP